MRIPHSSVVARAALRGIATLSAITAISSPVHAQRPNPPTIPTVLATAIMHEFSSALGDTPHFVVDAVPDGWPQTLMPPVSLRTIGGMKIGTLSVAVFSMPRSAEASGGFLPLLARAGFKPLVNRSTEGGFVNATPGPVAFCGDSSVVTVVPVDSSSSTRWIAVARASGEMSSGCNTERVRVVHSAELELPHLEAPREASVRSTSVGRGGHSVETTTRLKTSLSVDAVLTHYATQLSAAGFSVSAPPLVGDGVAVRQVSTRDKRGTDWRGVLLLITSGNAHELTLRMTKAGEK